MPFRVFPDGSIQVDTVDEAVELQAKLDAIALAKRELAAKAKAEEASKCATCGDDFGRDHTCIGYDRGVARSAIVTGEWDPPSGTWYFHCKCKGIRRENSSIRATIDGARCSKCGTRADRPGGVLTDGDGATVDPEPVQQDNPYDKPSRNVRPDHVALPMRWTMLGEERHVTRTDCCVHVTCPVCKGRRHTWQAGGTEDTWVVWVCEVCDAGAWTDVEETKADASATPGSAAWWQAFSQKHGRDPTPAELTGASKGSIPVMPGTTNTMKVVHSRAFAPREYREDKCATCGDDFGRDHTCIGTASGSSAGGIFHTEDKTHGIIGTGGDK